MLVRQQRGYTLVELVVVVAILAVIAAIAVPASSSNNDTKLDLAAQEYAAAIRYARSESMRTGEPHGFRERSNEKYIDLFRLDSSTSPATLIYDVMHPINKSLYHFDLDLQSIASADTLNRDIIYSSACNQNDRVYFDANGTPWCSDPTSVLLRSYELQMYLGSDLKLITLDGITGRVTVQ